MSRGGWVPPEHGTWDTTLLRLTPSGSPKNKTGTVARRTVRILLEYFLVLMEMQIYVCHNGLNQIFKFK